MDEKSLSEKLIEMNNYGLRLLSLWDSNHNIFDYLPDLDRDLIWAVGEGHTAEFYIKRIECRCSLQDSLDFDMEQAESEIEDKIQQLKRIEEAIHGLS